MTIDLNEFRIYFHFFVVTEKHIEDVFILMQKLNRNKELDKRQMFIFSNNTLLTGYEFIDSRALHSFNTYTIHSHRLWLTCDENVLVHINR